MKERAIHHDLPLIVLSGSSTFYKFQPFVERVVEKIEIVHTGGEAPDINRKAIYTRQQISGMLDYHSSRIIEYLVI